MKKCLVLKGVTGINGLYAEYENGVLRCYRCRLSLGGRDGQRLKKGPFPPTEQGKLAAITWLSTRRTAYSQAQRENLVRTSPEYAITFAEAAQDYLKQAIIKDVQGRTHILNDWVIPTFGKLPAASITRRDCRELLVAYRAKGYDKKRRVWG